MIEASQGNVFLTQIPLVSEPSLRHQQLLAQLLAPPQHSPSAIAAEADEEGEHTSVEGAEEEDQVLMQ